MPVRHFRCLRKYAKPWKKTLATRMAYNPTDSEERLWKAIGEYRLGPEAKVHRQKIILGFIADFWVPSAGLVVEVDGSSHNRRKEKDRHRDNVFKRKGIVTMRFTVEEVMNSLPAVVSLVKEMIRRRLK